jgi:hypothetical protein
MTCTLCGASMTEVVTDLPFKTTDHTIVIVKPSSASVCQLHGIPHRGCGDAACRPDPRVR